MRVTRIGYNKTGATWVTQQVTIRVVIRVARRDYALGLRFRVEGFGFCGFETLNLRLNPISPKPSKPKSLNPRNLIISKPKAHNQP